MKVSFCGLSLAALWSCVGRLIEIAHKTCRPEPASVGGWTMCKALMCLHRAILETDPMLTPGVSQRTPVGYLSD